MTNTTSELVETLLDAPTLDPEVAELVARTFGALGDKTRAAMVYALTREERSVNELAALVGISPSAVSHHLKGLRDIRLVKHRKVGTTVFYSVDDAHVGALFSEALHHLAHVLHGLPDHHSNGR